MKSLFGLSSRQLASRVCFFSLVAAFPLVAIVCLVNAFGWIDKPFAGFLINQRIAINGMGQYYWTGVKAGLNHPDRILMADGQPLVTSRDLERIVSAVPIGTPIRYTIERRGNTFEIDIPTMRFSVGDFIVLVGTLYLAGLFYLVLGTVVFVLKPDTAVSWSHLLLCWALGAFSITAFDVAATHAGFIRWYFLFTALIPAAGIHLSMLFPEPRAFVQKRPWLQFVPYGLAATILIPIELFYPSRSFLISLNVLYIYLILAAFAVFGASLASYLWQDSVIARQRSKVVLFGAALAFPIPALGELAMYRGWDIGGVSVQANFLAIPVVFFPAAIAYAIAKHNLFDVDVYIKRTVGYALMTAIVALAYFAVQTVVSTFVLRPVFGAQAENLYPIIFALLVVFFFNPVNRRVQEGVETLFFRKPYDYRAMVASVGDALTSLVDLNAIITKVISSIRQQMFVDKAGVILLDDQKRDCQALFMGEGDTAQAAQTKELCLSIDDPLLVLLAKEKKLITKYDIAEDPRYAHVSESCGQRFEDLGASLAFPLYSRDKITGVLAMGYKKSGHFYTREDIDLLKTVSAMTSTAIEQAREKVQREVLMKMFSKAVSPEVAEALWEQRDQFLDGGRPRSQKLMVTVMFTDLEGFSSVSERFDPDILMGWLNTYMEAITKTVMDHRGVVDDYFGDGVKVNFGVPVPRTTDAEIRHDAINSVRCALSLEREVIRLNAMMKNRGLPTLRMRIGINTGPVVAGSLGSEDRMKYTTLGDTVNTAARLETFSKELSLPNVATSPCRILISESTWRSIGEEFKTERVGELSLKGKDQRIPTYCVLGYMEAVPGAVTTAEKEA